MPVNPDIIGREFLAPEPFVVSAERVSSFSTALRRDRSSIPTTFPITASLGAMESLALDPELGIDWARVVHGDQRFKYNRPLEIGASLRVCTVVDSLEVKGNNEIVGVRSTFEDEQGVVVTSWATIVVRGQK